MSEFKIVHSSRHAGPDPASRNLKVSISTGFRIKSGMTIRINLLMNFETVFEEGIFDQHPDTYGIFIYVN
jgi:hypothetical protein